MGQCNAVEEHKDKVHHSGTWSAFLCKMGKKRKAERKVDRVKGRQSTKRDRSCDIFYRQKGRLKGEGRQSRNTEQSVYQVGEEQTAARRQRREEEQPTRLYPPLHRTAGKIAMIISLTKKRKNAAT